MGGVLPLGVTRGGCVAGCSWIGDARSDPSFVVIIPGSNKQTLQLFLMENILLAITKARLTLKEIIFSLETKEMKNRFFFCNSEFSVSLVWKLGCLEICELYLLVIKCVSPFVICVRFLYSTHYHISVDSIGVAYVYDTIKTNTAKKFLGFVLGFLYSIHYHISVVGFVGFGFFCCFCFVFTVFFVF